MGRSRSPKHRRRSRSRSQDRRRDDRRCDDDRHGDRRRDDRRRNDDRHGDRRRDDRRSRSPRRRSPRQDSSRDNVDSRRAAAPGPSPDAAPGSSSASGKASRDTASTMQPPAALARKEESYADIMANAMAGVPGKKRGRHGGESGDDFGAAGGGGGKPQWGKPGEEPAAKGKAAGDWACPGCGANVYASKVRERHGFADSLGARQGTRVRAWPAVPTPMWHPSRTPRIMLALVPPPSPPPPTCCTITGARAHVRSHARGRAPVPLLPRYCALSGGVLQVRGAQARDC
jgi:hypothetical protein